MRSLKELYKNHIYGVMGTLIFHILVVTGFWISELNYSIKTEKEEEVFVLDMLTPPVEKEKEETKEISKTQEESEKAVQSYHQNLNMGTNHGVNDALKTNKFFDDNYKRDIEDAEKMVDKVNKQLSKKIPQSTQFAMPEISTEGQQRDSIKNTIYTGKSNIHYYLENRFHVRLPIPVFLAKSGGLITIDILVDRNGRVTKAEARSVTNISDPMLPVYATQAAERTVFNADSKAPASQKGTITYRFVAQ
jgi:hypothetical protein